MDLEDIRVSEISLKDKYGMITYMWNKKKNTAHTQRADWLPKEGQDGWREGKMDEENIHYIWELLRQ